MPYAKWLPQRGTMREMFLRWPELARPLSEFTEVLMRGSSPFTEAQRELIAAVTSATNQCRFCYGTHKVTAQNFGIDEKVFEQIQNDVATADIEAEMKPVLAYAQKLTLTPTRVTQADADAIFDAGWNDQAFHHTVSICGLFNYYNRILEGYGIVMDQSYYDEAGDRLKELGYLYSPERYSAGNSS